jgi:hypothetical protein
LSSSQIEAVKEVAGDMDVSEQIESVEEDSVSRVMLRSKQRVK